jgi:hypothetical protein
MQVRALPPSQRSALTTIIRAGDVKGHHHHEGGLVGRIELEDAFAKTVPS